MQGEADRQREEWAAGEGEAMEKGDKVVETIAASVVAVVVDFARRETTAGAAASASENTQKNFQFDSSYTHRDRERETVPLFLLDVPCSLSLSIPLSLPGCLSSSLAGSRRFPGRNTY